LYVFFVPRRVSFFAILAGKLETEDQAGNPLLSSAGIGESCGKSGDPPGTQIIREHVSELTPLHSRQSGKQEDTGTGQPG
jgi:hypothetical protein